METRETYKQEMMARLEKCYVEIYLLDLMAVNAESDAQVRYIKFWMCDECGYTTIAGLPPESCPECGGQRNFTNRTCYVPEMGASDTHDVKMYTR